ncbi:MAG: hypothetical protein INR64_16515, partial [Caulobacteraceae bacterium]|nr:hypothetical protein [Caulobacter sp.]
TARRGAGAEPPGFWRTVLVLLGAARRRADGRRTQQRKMFKQRTGRDGDTLGCFGVVFTILVALATHCASAYATAQVVQAGQRLAVERQGRFVVDSALVDLARHPAHGDIEVAIAREAVTRSRRDATSPSMQGSRLRNALLMRGPSAFVAEETAAPGLDALTTSGLPALLGSLALLVWSLAVVLQGEGLEVDVQRRRHPMWEWLFSHPVPPGAVFLAEMLAPIAANPIYWTAPLYPGILYAKLYGPGAGIAAAALVGVPIAISAACLGKGLEATVMLRASVRSRGALIGMMSWAGFAAAMGLFFAAFAIDKVAAVLAVALAPIASLPWPALALFLGKIGRGASSFPAGVLACLAGSGAIVAGSVAVSVWAADAGLTGRLDRRDVAPRRAATRARVGGNPLYRKELTWFVRDRSALVQAILIPLTLAGVQLFNFRGLFEMASHDWTYVCGGAVIVGTYFLSNLGPKSLVSEGATLWLALTWPCSLENLLKAKARLWALLSYAVVGLALAYALWLYPAAWPGIGLVGLGWLVFARSMAEKAVTLATVTSDSGEVRRVPAGRQWAVLLGTLSFASGILTRQWSLALVGIVYSWLTAAAMWQNFRARLPFLLDPWSERLPPPPTLMHAMIAISCLVDGGAALIGLVVGAFGRGGVAIAFPIAYGAAAAIVARRDAPRGAGRA